MYMYTDRYMYFRVHPSLNFMLERSVNPCPSKATGLTASEQAAVLAAHNDARANAFPVPLPALTPLTWDDDVASVAQRLADQCM